MEELTASTRKAEKIRRFTLAQDLLFEAEAAAEKEEEERARKDEEERASVEYIGKLMREAEAAAVIEAERIRVEEVIAEKKKQLAEIAHIRRMT